MTTPGEVDLWDEVFESRLLDINVAGPARVERYDEARRVADLQLMIRRRVPDNDGGSVYETVAMLPSVPVLMIFGGPFSLTFKLAPGDTVLALACSQDIAQWRITGEISDPKLKGFHDWSWAVAIPGLTSSVKALPFDPTAPLVEGSLKVGAGAVPLVKESQMLVELGKIASAINAIVPGSYTPPAIGFLGTTKLQGE